jgi:hypothetical protein
MQKAANVTGNKFPESQIISSEITGSDQGPSLSGSKTPLRSEDYAKSMLRLEVATYIGQMSAELSVMARNSEMPLLSYFLDMAAAEARGTDGQLRDALTLGSEPENDTAIARA